MERCCVGCSNDFETCGSDTFTTDKNNEFDWCANNDKAKNTGVRSIQWADTKRGYMSNNVIQIESIIKDQFTLTCNKCQSIEVSINFYEGFIHSQGGDTGSLILECRKCKNKIELP
jgi:hypothetical protein